MTKANERFSLLVACMLCKVNAKLNMNLVVCMLNAMAAHVCKLMEQAKFGRGEWVEDGEIATQVKSTLYNGCYQTQFFLSLARFVCCSSTYHCNRVRDDFLGRHEG